MGTDSAQISPDQISFLMEGLRQGNNAAAGELVALFYPELRRIAKWRMSGSGARILGNLPYW